jgi:hypothetical protein
MTHEPEPAVSRNLKTALLLGAISLTTFALIIAKYWIMNG